MGSSLSVSPTLMGWKQYVNNHTELRLSNAVLNDFKKAFRHWQTLLRCNINLPVDRCLQHSAPERAVFVLLLLCCFGRLTLTDYGGDLLMNLNYSYRQISCCSECITVSSGCGFSQNLWNNEVICMANTVSESSWWGYGGSHLDFTYIFIMILYHCSNF